MSDPRIVTLPLDLADKAKRVYKAARELQDALEGIAGTRLGALVTVDNGGVTGHWPNIHVKVIAPIYVDEVHP